jgi:hypothetical protein
MYNNLKILLDKNSEELRKFQESFNVLSQKILISNLEDLKEMKADVESISTTISFLLGKRIYIFKADKVLSWRDVLDVKINVGSQDRMFRHATNLGYDFYIWNDNIFNVNIGEPIATINDLK